MSSLTIFQSPIRFRLSVTQTSFSTGGGLTSDCGSNYASGGLLEVFRYVPSTLVIGTQPLQSSCLGSDQRATTYWLGKLEQVSLISLCLSFSAKTRIISICILLMMRRLDDTPSSKPRSPLFPSWRNWGTQGLGDLVKVAQLDVEACEVRQPCSSHACPLASPTCRIAYLWGLNETVNVSAQNSAWAIISRFSPY